MFDGVDNSPSAPGSAKQKNVNSTAFSHSPRRAVLSCHQARAIFLSKPPLSASRRRYASKLSKVYGVSPKTIIDIWVGRTWYRETCVLDQTKPVCSERLERKVGRPRGAKDMKPRSKKKNMQAGQLWTVEALSAPAALHVPKAVAFHTPKNVEHRSLPAPYASFCTQAAAKTSYNSILPIDWAAYLSDNCDRFSKFTDPFHDDWAFWPLEDGMAS